jgi:hypothetical protein
MIKRIFILLVIAVASAYLGSCDNNEEAIKTFHTLADVSNSAVSDAKYDVITVFSTDGGTTFMDYPNVKKGGTYLVKVVNRTSDGDVDLTGDNCFDVDWSQSSPQPTDPSADLAEFKMGENNEIKATVTNLYKPYDASSWAGDWVGAEDGACCSSNDPNTLRQDTSDPNKYIMDNFWGDGVDAYIIFSPSTKLDDQIVTLPEQTTSEGGVASGTGTYDQCAGTFVIYGTTYVIGGSTYVFDYYFERE